VVGGLQEEEAALVLVEEEAEAAEAFREEEVEDFRQEAEELPEEVSHVDVDNPSLFVDIWRFGYCLRSSSYYEAFQIKNGSNLWMSKAQLFSRFGNMF
jgi:hypothetical protein